LKDGGEASPRGRGSRPNSVLSIGQLSGDNVEAFTPPIRPTSQSIATQTTPIAPETPVLEAATARKSEILTYSKAVQTDSWTEPSSRSVDGLSETENGDSPRTSRANRRLSRRERERDEEIRESLRKEIEEELQVTKGLTDGGIISQSAQLRYPLRTLTNDELSAVTSSNEFLDFVERSSKVIERALDEEYDILADYALGGIGAEEEDDDDYGAARVKKRPNMKEVAQFWDERWSKKRMISDISFSPKVCSP